MTRSQQNNKSHLVVVTLISQQQKAKEIERSHDSSFVNKVGASEELGVHAGNAKYCTQASNICIHLSYSVTIFMFSDAVMKRLAKESNLSPVNNVLSPYSAQYRVHKQVYNTRLTHPTLQGSVHFFFHQVYQQTLNACVLHLMQKVFVKPIATMIPEASDELRQQCHSTLTLELTGREVG